MTLARRLCTFVTGSTGNFVLRCSQEACAQDAHLMDAGCCSPDGCDYTGTRTKRSMAMHAFAKRETSTAGTAVGSLLSVFFLICLILLILRCRRRSSNNVAVATAATANATANNQASGNVNNVYVMAPPQQPQQAYPMGPGSPPPQQPQQAYPMGPGSPPPQQYPIYPTSQSPPPPQPAYFNPAQPNQYPPYQPPPQPQGQYQGPYVSEPVGPPPSYKDTGNHA